MKNFILSILLVFFFTGCNAYKAVVYVQNAGNAVSYADSIPSVIPDPTLKIGDLLIITVNSSTPESAMPFNLPLLPGSEGLKNYSNVSSNMSISNGGSGLQNYLIDTHGDIIFPIIGKIHASGMTKTALADYLKNKIYPFYIKDEPIISIRYTNYKVSVLGEVGHPGVFDIQNEKINIFEAIALAGDLSLFGKRDNVLLIREKANGKRETLRIDLRDARLIDSPYFYLQQNDVLYVQPNEPKSRSGFFSTAESLSLSVVGTLISLTTLIISLSK
ncbi:MAG TPA: polysaccharide biosynthesis/export family protein [Paludibacter sp.]